MKQDTLFCFFFTIVTGTDPFRNRDSSIAAQSIPVPILVKSDNAVIFIVSEQQSLSHDSQVLNIDPPYLSAGLKTVI